MYIVTCGSHEAYYGEDALQAHEALGYALEVAHYTHPEAKVWLDGVWQDMDNGIKLHELTCYGRVRIQQL